MKKGLAKKFIVSLLAASMAIAVLAYKANPRLFITRKPGSFEYIREGQAALDKDEYLRAIGLFEKALQASPGNKAIQDYMIWAYTKYGAALEEKENYDGALIYLKKARAVRHDGIIIKNLAAIHARKALKFAKEGEWPGATREFEEARTLAGDSARAAKDLTAMLLNDAAGEYKSGREHIAIFCLKESLLIDENFRAMDLLADIYYKRSDLEKAVFYWTRAKELEPENAVIAEKLGKALREMGLAKEAKVIPAPHFELVYKTPIPPDAESAKDILEDAYLKVGKDLDYFPSPKTTVIFYSEADFRDTFKISPIVRAFYDGNIRIPIRDSGLMGEDLKRHLYHEYTHAAVSAMTNNSCPVWLQEGIATREEVVEGGLRLMSPGELRYISLTSLEDAFTNQVKDTDIRPYYFLAYTAVEFMINDWGISALRNILKRLAAGEHALNAMDDELLLSEKEFESRWHAYIREKYK